MKRVLSGLLAVAMVVAIASTAAAAPILSATFVENGNGTVTWTVALDANDGAGLSAIVDLRFQSSLGSVLGQTKAFGVLDVNDVVNANVLHNPPLYDKQLDSWFYVDGTGVQGDWTGATPSIFPANNGGGGGTAGMGVGSTAAYMSYGTGALPGGAFNVGNVAQIVLPSTADCLVVDGIIGRQGVDYPVDLTFCIPEPSSIALLGLGLVGLVVGYLRRRR
jgi:hypothetical protein